MTDHTTVDELLDTAHHHEAYRALPKGDTYRDLSTVIITAVRGERVEKRTKSCPHCDGEVHYETTVATGFHPYVVESWKRMIRPMNQPIVEIIASGYEVGDAYERSVEAILKDERLSGYRYVMFIEDDIVVPFMPGTKGPLWQLYTHMADYDVASGLYWTKGEISMPLIFGDPAKGTDNYECLTNWERDDVVECNGTGMGFTLMKMDLFRDARIERPWFLSLENVSEGQMTQDLYFYKKIRELGYRVCVDTSIRCGHVDVGSGIVY